MRRANCPHGGDSRPPEHGGGKKDFIRLSWVETKCL